MKPIEILKQKWALNNLTDLNYDIQENYHLKNGKIVDFGIILNGKCIASGKYFPKLEVEVDNPDSRIYFHKYFKVLNFDINFAFYFDDSNLILNDLRYKYPLDELLNDYNELYERIK